MTRRLYFFLVGRSPTTDVESNRVRQVRVGSGLTQAQLAEAVGVSRQTVNALEAGNYAPSVYLALRVAAVLATTVEELFAVKTSTHTTEKR
jgi:putative transcriptional regulator